MPRRAAHSQSDHEPPTYPRTVLSIRNRRTLSLRTHLRLAHCRNLLMAESRHSVEPWGLTLPQFNALAKIAATRGGLFFQELSRLLLVTSGNTTGIVDALEKLKLVKRQPWDEDRRVVWIVITRKGQRLMHQISPIHARNIGKALSFLPAEQLCALDRLLSTLSSGLRAARPSRTLFLHKPKTRASARLTRWPSRESVRKIPKE